MEVGEDDGDERRSGGFRRGRAGRRRGLRQRAIRAAARASSLDPDPGRGEGEIFWGGGFVGVSVEWAGVV